MAQCWQQARFTVRTLVQAFAGRLPLEFAVCRSDLIVPVSCSIAGGNQRAGAPQGQVGVELQQEEANSDCQASLGAT